jgi:hypothetical protein
MAYTLKSRDRQIPNGLKFLQPETNWQAPKFASFNVIVNSLINHRRSNPHLVKEKNWSLDPNEVANEVDQFNALLCARHGWSDFIHDGASMSEGPPPKSQALLQQEKSVIAAAAGKAKKIWSGIRTLNDWLDSGTPPAPQALAESRAAVCAACPKNGKGDFTSWFTNPAADAIKQQVEKLALMRLKTKHDSVLNVCEVCLCPLKLKSFTPIKYIKDNLSVEVLNDLKNVPNCWIPKEVAE